jgi:hypothetical protein
MPKVSIKKAGKSSKAKKTSSKFTINCALPIEDNVIVLGDFSDYLT